MYRLCYTQKKPKMFVAELLLDCAGAAVVLRKWPTALSTERVFLFDFFTIDFVFYRIISVERFSVE